jgi:hypothetical protein
MYHFTRSVAAIHAVDHGLARAVTPNDPLPESGVWLSPNLYVEGSEFGPIGLRVADHHLAACECVYIGPKPGNPGRHRLLLLPNGANLPEGVARQPTPEGLPNAQDACELLLVGDVPAAQIEGVIFGDERGRSEEASQLEHTFFFAHLLAGNHRLLGATKDPHSTVWSVHGGWWTFDKLRGRLVEAGARQGGAATAAGVNAVVRRFATHGLGGRDGLQALDRESIHRRVTEAYAAAYLAATSNALDLADDRPYVPEEE